MIARWILQPVVAGLVTLLLALLDWMLTVLLAHAARGSYRDHYATYPTDTVEGNPIWQRAVARGRWVDPRHLAAAAAFAVLVGAVVQALPDPRSRHLFLGVAWGSLLLVMAPHVANAVACKAGQRGVHGRIRIHQRTAYLMTAGRYAGMTAVLAGLTAVVGHPFLFGVTLAGMLAVFRQLLARRRIPDIEPGDPPPNA